MAHRVVAFVGKQDPHRPDGTPGPVLSAARLLRRDLRADVTGALLLSVEGASDRADGRDEGMLGMQGLRSEELQSELRALWPDLPVQHVQLHADPTDARALLRALRADLDVQAFRAGGEGVQTHLLMASGTPAMREVLAAAQFTEFFGRTRGWYRPDRGDTLREEVPLAVEAALLASLRTAVQVGEFRAARLLLPELRHDQSGQVGDLLDLLHLEQVGDRQGAWEILVRWSPPEALSAWKDEALRALKLHGAAGGQLMHLWNATQVRSPREALLAYATLLEEGLRALCGSSGVRVEPRSTAEGMAGALQRARVPLPVELDAAAGVPKRLYSARNGAIHAGTSVAMEDLPVIQEAATQLVRAYPTQDEELAAFLRRPHHNAFAPQRYGELAQVIFSWLSS
ncbi:hypothetical protein [Deinococcus sp. JMULE3]|uniref:hypothetical protein n=1 Tax=Deinococcus sp. JMULE3 TaxID=2518341 RepID=UPI001577758F|nr:hypothetical protein [Deinococcus sp. JMULE3]NTY02548.1 hypothetical protein [Deinococcus sp. JMULE3]